jgi:hypothetical protein
MPNKKYEDWIAVRRTDLEKALDHVWLKEKKDFELNPRGTHIFLTLRKLDRATRTKGIPND